MALVAAVFVLACGAVWSDFERHLQRLRRRAGGVRCYKAFDYLPIFWNSAWQGFTEHWINGVGIRGWGSMVVSMESINVLPVSERWHPHLYALEVAVDTGIPGLLGYALFFVFLGRRLFDSRPEVATEFTGCHFGAVSLNSSVSFYSYFNGNILFLTLALLIALDRISSRSRSWILSMTRSELDDTVRACFILLRG
ncbi:MAG: hypothetical protein CM15mP125_3770 [Gammaproteobacteria bacterium]|nr:MAG: hypothetical protein CM15mP125_3770 [Gammaproteobacteria bacterium]